MQEMTFDQEARYRLAAEVLRAAAGPEPLVLDVGSREGFLTCFLPEARVFNLDREPYPGKAFVRADAEHLPFPDACFDAVIALDVLEHLPREGRPGLLRELARASRRAVLVSAPFAEPGVAEAEKLANEFHLLLTGREHPYLCEHQAYGLPELSETLEGLPGPEWASAVFPGPPLDEWLALMGLNLYLATLPNSWGTIGDINRIYREKFSRPGAAGSCYGRTVAWFRGGRPRLPDLPSGEGKGLGPEFFREALASVRRGIEVYARDYDELSQRHDQDLAKLQGVLEAAQAAHRADVAKLTGLLEQRAADIGLLKAALDRNVRKKILNRLFPSRRRGRA